MVNGCWCAVSTWFDVEIVIARNGHDRWKLYWIFHRYFYIYMHYDIAQRHFSMTVLSCLMKNAFILFTINNILYYIRYWFLLLFSGYTCIKSSNGCLMYLPILFRVASVALGQSYVPSLWCFCLSPFLWQNLLLGKLNSKHSYANANEANLIWLPLWDWNMMMSWLWNASRVTGPLWGESTGDRWIPFTKCE